MKIEIVPAYNEEKGLPVVLEALQVFLTDSFEIIVVDDGSTDATAEVARRFRCRMISHKTNRGKGTMGDLGDTGYLELFDRNRRQFEQKWNIKWHPHGMRV